MLEKLKVYGPWIYRAVVLVIIAMLAWSWNSAHRAQAALAKELEKERLEKAGLLAERDASKRDLTNAEQQILKASAEFQAEKDRLEKILGEKPKTIEVVKWQTKTVTIEVPANTPDRECPTHPVEGHANKPKILLIEGDQGHVEAGEVTYGTKDGNRVFLAEAACFRDSPLPKLRLFTSVISAPVSVALAKPIEPKFSWGAGVTAMGTSDKVGLGPLLLFPLFEALGLQGDLSAGVTFGSNGFTGAAANFGVRWR